MENKFISVKGSENNLIGSICEGKEIIGWSRRDTSSEGKRSVGFGTYSMEITLKFKDGTRTGATLIQYTR